MTRLIVLFLALALLVLIVPSNLSAQNMLDPGQWGALRPLTAADTTYLETYRNMPIGKIHDRVWLETCDLNRKVHPDSNLVNPGDTLLLPLGFRMVAGYEPNHQYAAAGWFAYAVVSDYLAGKYIARKQQRVPPDTTKQPVVVQDGGYPWVAALLGALIVLAIILYRKRHALLIAIGPSARKEEPKQDRPPFVANPPRQGAPEAEVLPVVQEALGRVYGRNFTVVPGTLEEGEIDGTQVIFFADGSNRTERFNKEPGVRATLKFEDGSQYKVISRLECFNPVWGAQGARYTGTFTPRNGKAERVPIITVGAVAATAASIRAIATGKQADEYVNMIPPFAEVQPAAAKVQPPKVDTPPVVPEPPVHTDVVAKLTKFSVSRNNGLTMEAAEGTEIEFSFDQIAELSVIATGNPRSKPTEVAAPAATSTETDKK